MVEHICNSSYWEAKIRKIMVQGHPRKNLVRPYLKNKPAMVVWCLCFQLLGR
jgi:hypothetical protein